jgi:hypothetical protein
MANSTEPQELPEWAVKATWTERRTVYVRAESATEARAMVRRGEWDVGEDLYFGRVRAGKAVKTS